MIYNHLQFEVKVHYSNTDPKEERIVGFNVLPMSKAYDEGTQTIHACDHTANYEPQYLDSNTKFRWTYCIRTVVSKSKISLIKIPNQIS